MEPAHSTHQDLSTPQHRTKNFLMPCVFACQAPASDACRSNNASGNPVENGERTKKLPLLKEGCSKLFSNSGRYVTLNAEHISHPPGISVPTFVPAHVADMPCRRRSAVSSEAAQKFAGTGFAPLRRESMLKHHRFKDIDDLYSSGRVSEARRLLMEMRPAILPYVTKTPC